MNRPWLWPLLVLAIYAYPFPHFEGLRSPNELSRLYQVRALVDDHTLSVNESLRRYGSMGDMSEFHGRFFPNKAPGISFVGAGVYGVLRSIFGEPEQISNRGLLYFLRLFCCALPTALLTVPLRRYVRRISGDDRAADAAMLVYLFGSLACTYSILFLSHQLTAVLAMASFLALEQGRRSRSALWPLAGGLAAAYAVVTEYPAAPVALALGIYAVATARRRLAATLAFGLGALPCAVLLLWYHKQAFGSPFATGYAHVTNQTFASWHAQGYMGVAMPRITSLLGNLFSAGRGLFAFAPAFLLALPGLRLLAARDRADARLATTVLAFYFFLASAFLYEAWGWVLGPRHLAPLMPFLVAPLACALAWLRAHKPGWSGLAGGLCAASILVTGTATVVYPHIPEEFTGAVAHLIWPLLSHGFLPYNLAETMLGRVAPWTWIPWFAALLVVAVLAAHRAAVASPRRWLLVVGAVTLHLAVLFVAIPSLSEQERKTQEWIMKGWEPTPANVRRGLIR
jgi:hypothetical protein